MDVEVDIEEADLENDEGREQSGVIAVCSRCGHTVESFGTGDRSRRRCLAMLREECPQDERNFYVDSEGLA